MTFDTFDDRPFYQRMGYKIGSHPITMHRESPANAPARITAPNIDSEVDALNAQPGRNPVEKAIKLFCSRDPAFASVPWSEQCRIGGEYSRTLMEGRLPNLMAGKTVAAAAPTPADKAAAILKAIGATKGADLVAKTVAYCKANSVVALTSVADDLQNQAATALIARLQKGDPTDFAGMSANTSGTSQIAARVPTNVQGMVDLLNSQQGRNPVEKAVTLLASRDPSFKSLEWGEQVRRGGEFSRELMAGRMPKGLV